MIRHSSLSIAIFVALTMLAMPVANAEIDGRQVLEGLGVSPSEIEEIESGGMLTFSDEAYENTKRELAADAVILVDSDLITIFNEIISEPTLVPSHVVIDSSMVESDADFAGVMYTDAEFDEVKDLFKAKPGKKHNFSASDFEILREFLDPHVHSDATSQIAAASDAMRAILIRRYNEYRANGLDGIDSYQRSRKKTVDIARELRLTTETFAPFASDFPEFYGVMHDYPEGAECCEHFYRWIKVEIRDRPTFALSHTFVQKTDDYVLATERYYFVTSTLNSLQVTLSWLKYDENTYMGLAMTASTDLLDSMMGRMLRPIGRNKAKDMVSDIMLDVKCDLDGGDESTDCPTE